jgi:hypothetical protein
MFVAFTMNKYVMDSFHPDRTIPDTSRKRA